MQFAFNAAPGVCRMKTQLLEPILKCCRNPIKRMFGFAHVSSVYEIHRLVLQLLWNLLQIIVSIWYFVLGTTASLESYLISSGLLRNYKAIDLTELRYLAIVVDSEEAKHTSKVVKLLLSLSTIGVKHVCLYDVDGLLEESKDTILKEIGHAKKLEMEVDGHVSFLDQSQMTLEFASFINAKQGVAKAASFLCSKYSKAADLGGDHKDPVFTEANMTRALTAVACGGPEPNLLLVYGPARCHLGFPAWRLRYTEIVHMGQLKHMQYGALVKAIHKFTRVHQNYGT